MAHIFSAKKLPQNPFLLFLPFLFLYIIIVLILQNKEVWGDEHRHILHAENILKGYYAEPIPSINFDIGPGYPILLAPFLKFDIPFLWVKLMNALFQYLSIIFLFKALRYFISFRISLLVCIFWGIYYNAFYYLPIMYTECFTSFLISLFLLSLVKAFKQEGLPLRNKNLYYSGLLFGYIALTKAIFGYVLLVMLIGCFIIWLWNRKNISCKKVLLILVSASFVVTPYLFYTYQITGKVFYWATSGGSNLYWMSTPYEGEYGTWFPDVDITSKSLYALDTLDMVHNNKLLQSSRPFFIPGFQDSVVNNHLTNFIEISNYSKIEKDDALKKIALRNIQNHPVKFIKNCFSNIGRILFNTPNSYVIQQPGNLTKLPLNGIIVLLSLFCIIPTLLNWRKIDYLLKFILFFTLLYLGGSVLGSAEIRMFTTVVPLLLFWIAFIITKSIKIKLKFQ